MIETRLFYDMLNIESTSSNERAFADFLADRLPIYGCSVSIIPADAAEGEPVNLLFEWGVPRIVFCTHLDTVPPYIPPTSEATPDGDTIISGRGTCDAKGQIMAMYTACGELAQEGFTDFGLLLLYGEETGSYGAKEYRNYPGCEYLVVGEPTDNCMVSASKGTKAFGVTVHGRSFHSGYPQYGDSAIERFVDMVNELRDTTFPDDPLLGATTYNIGKLISDNPQNTLSDKLTCRIYFRTTFATDQMVGDVMRRIASRGNIDIETFGGDAPTRYLTLPGFKTKTVAFGSDAPQLTNYTNKMLCGPGSILVAHRDDEHILLSQLREAVDNYKKIYHQISSK